MHRRRRSATRAGLIALNTALLVALLATALTPLAGAQRATTDKDRGPGDYTMVAGRVQGLAESAIYIVDAANQEMLAVRWDRSTRKLEPIGYRDLALDAKQAQGGGR